MQRNRNWLSRWGGFLTGVAIGLAIITPVLAAPSDSVQIADYVLESLLALGGVAILVLVVLLVAVATAESPRELEPAPLAPAERDDRPRG